MSTLPPTPTLVRRASLGLGLAVLAGAAIAAASVGNTVTIAADGEVTELRTTGDTVAEALTDAEIELGRDDVVEPASDTPIESDLDIEVHRAIAVDVEIDGVTTRTISTVAETVDDVLAAADIDPSDDDPRIEPAPDAEVADGDTVTVTYPVEIVVEADDEEHELSTFAERVDEVLDEAGIELGADDIVDPEPDERLDDTDVITVQRVDVEEDVEEVSLEADERREETDDLERGESRVEQEGRDGVKVRTYEVTIIDGEEAERELVDESVEEEPRARIVLIGTAEPDPEPEPAPSGAPSGGVWDQLAACESNGNWSANTGNGYYGGLQFLPSTWRSVGGSGLPHEASREEQINRAQILQQRSGWGQWPACSSMLGLR